MRALAEKFPLALVTNGIASVQNKRFAASPITPYFKAIVISEEVGIAKPDPRIFEPALQKIGVAAADVLYVGDSVSSDMAAARNAGMDFCWLNPGGAPVPDGHSPAYVIAQSMSFPASPLSDLPVKVSTSQGKFREKKYQNNLTILPAAMNNSIFKEER